MKKYVVQNIGGISYSKKTGIVFMVDGKTHRLLLKKEDRSPGSASGFSAHCQFYLDGKKNHIPASFLPGENETEKWELLYDIVDSVLLSLDPLRITDTWLAAHKAQYAKDILLLDPNNIAFRKRTNTDKTNKMAADMKKNGWTDRPILIYTDTRNIYIALTGTHRVMAASRTGLKEIPAVIIRCAEDNFTKLFEARDDKERARIACELYVRGEIPRTARDLLIEEEWENNKYNIQNMLSFMKEKEARRANEKL